MRREAAPDLNHDPKGLAGSKESWMTSGTPTLETTTSETKKPARGSWGGRSRLFSDKDCLSSDPWSDASPRVPILSRESRDPSIYLKDPVQDPDGLETFVPTAGAIQQRAIFSSDVRRLLRYEAVADRSGQENRRGYRGSRSSSRLLDDLINRPMDQMYEDSTLTAHWGTPVQKWIQKAISFILCVVIGISGMQAIRLLQKDTRAKVRATLSQQVTTAVKRQKTVEDQVSKLQSQRDSQISSIRKMSLTPRQESDNLADALTPVSGPGIKIVITNPTSEAQNGSNRVSAGLQKQTLTDSHMQIIVARLWYYGAEAISINGIRLGAQSSIRLAGNNILIGTVPISSPYTIEVIGDSNRLTSAIDETHNPQLRQTLQSYGIQVSFSRQGDLKLPAVTSVTVEKAKEK